MNGGAPIALAASPLWYATRGAGVVTLVLLTASVVLGILTTVRFATAGWPRFAVAGLHRNLSLLVLAFLAIHVATAVLDSFAPIRLLDAVLPFAGAYRPLWLGLGALALDLLLALALTSLVRLRLGFRAWRAVHWAAYACWPVALMHGLGTGTDARAGWVLALSATCVAAVIAAAWWRLTQGGRERVALRVGFGVLSMALPVLLAVWLAGGPLREGWARRAGTPAALLASHAPWRAPARPAPAALPRPPFSATLTGSIAESAPNASGEVAVRILAALRGDAPGLLDIVIDGQPTGDSGVAMTSSLVQLGPSAQPHLYRGRITALEGDRLRARLTSRTRRAISLSAVLQIDGNRVSGQLAASPGGGP